VSAGFLKRIVIVLFLVLASLFFYLQIIKGQTYYYLSKKNCIRVVPLVASRGTIYDRNGTKIVYDELSFDVCIIPKDAKDVSSTLSRVAAASGVSKETLYDNYKKNLVNPFTPVVLIKNAGFSLASTLEEQSMDFPGIVIWPVPLRTYPYQKAFAHLGGYLGKISPGEMESLSEYGYTIRDWVGKQGLEKVYDRTLKGTDGGMLVEVDNRGRMTKVLGLKYPKKGEDITTTVDIRVQKLLYELLEPYRAAGVVVDPQTGEVIAMVSTPSFDPNIFVQKTKNTQSTIQRLLVDKARVFLNRAVGGLYPPGSVFKPIVALAALEKHKISIHTTFECKGFYTLGSRRMYCWKHEGHGVLDIVQALKYSCNVFFFNTARRVGPAVIAEYASRFGLGKSTESGFAVEKKGLVPTPKWKKAFLKDNWYEGDTLNYGIGQGYLLVTPLQMCDVAAMSANGGYAFRPIFAKMIAGNPVAPQKKVKVPCDGYALEVGTRGMLKVALDDDGTGRAARVAGIRIAGKTGSAQRKGRAPDSWFICFFPFEQPRYAVAVMVESGGSGGGIPAHVAKQLVEGMKAEHII